MREVMHSCQGVRIAKQHIHACLSAQKKASSLLLFYFVGYSSKIKHMFTFHLLCITSQLMVKDYRKTVDVKLCTRPSLS